MSIAEELKEFALANEADYFGITPVSRMRNLPEHFRPTDLFPEAKCVIVLGMKLPKGAILAHEAANSGKREQIMIFTQFGVNRVIEMLNVAALRLVRRIEKLYGGVAMPIPSGEPHNEELWMGAISNRYAAMCAGLGEMTWCGFVATPEAGPRIRWVTVITDLELEPNALYGGPKLCQYPDCQICADACPAQALSKKNAVEVAFDGFKTSYASRSKPRCRCAVNGLIKGTPGRLQAELPEQMETMDDWHDFQRKDDHWNKMEFHHGNYCLHCMMACPIGKGEGQRGICT